MESTTRKPVLKQLTNILTQDVTVLCLMRFYSLKFSQLVSTLLSSFSTYIRFSPRRFLPEFRLYFAFLAFSAKNSSQGYDWEICFLIAIYTYSLLREFFSSAVIGPVVVTNRAKNEAAGQLGDLINAITT
jgi:hypothetical protein